MQKPAVWKTVADSYRFTFGNIGLLIKVSSAWFVVSFAATYLFGFQILQIGSTGIWMRLLLTSGVPVLVSMVAVSAMAVSWHRVILLNQRPAKLFDLTLDRRVWKYFGLSLAFSVLGVLLIFLSSIAIAATGGTLWLRAGLLVLTIMLIALLFARFCLLYSAIAVESVAVTLERSWYLTKGSALRLAFGAFVCAVPLSIPANLSTRWAIAQTLAGNTTSGFVVGMFGQTLPFLSAALVAAFLSYAYKKLVPETREES